MEDGAWMLWENYSAVAAVAAAVAVAVALFKKSFFFLKVVHQRKSLLNTPQMAPNEKVSFHENVDFSE